MSDPLVRSPQAQLLVQRIGDQARTSNLARVAELEQALSAAAGSSLTEEVRRAAVATAHQLVGSAGTFGYSRVSELARAVEGLFLADDITGPAAEAAQRSLVTMQQDLLTGPDEDDLEP